MSKKLNYYSTDMVKILYSQDLASSKEHEESTRPCILSEYI